MIKILIICGLFFKIVSGKHFPTDDGSNLNVGGRRFGNDEIAICPKICTCDMIDGFRRADCSNENLINTYTDVPDTVEILDLSINEITILDNDCLKKYTNIKKLFLSENSIHTIYLDTFSSMSSLSHLDLSENRLEYLDDRTFEHNHELIDLNLSRNKFMMLPDKALIFSDSLMFLDLSKTQLPHLFKSTLEGVPNLLNLDLSGNLLISLQTTAFLKLQKLEFLNLDENRWKCGNSMKDVLKWFSRRSVKIQIEKCFTSSKSSMFERMELFPNLSTEEESREDVDINLLWNTTNEERKTEKDYWAILDKSCLNPTNMSLDDTARKSCEDVLTCEHNKYHELYQRHKQWLNRHDQMKNMKIGFLLYAGLFLGIVIGMGVMYLICFIKERCFKNNKSREKRLRMRREFRERNNFEHSRLMESPLLHRNVNIRTTMPVSQRYDEMVDYRNSENTRQFLVNLFSKRQPRYLRNLSQVANLNSQLPQDDTIEGNEANVVVSELELEYQRSMTAMRNMFENNGNDDNARNIDLEMLLPSLRSSAISVVNDIYNDELTPSSAQDPVIRETPPPPYLDCAI